MTASFTCPACHMTSYNVEDIRNGYCGNCHQFTGTRERTQHCPNCGSVVTMVPYDIGSGPEMSCPECEWCWGADGQPLRQLDVGAIMHTINQERADRGLGPFGHSDSPPPGDENPKA